MARPDMVVFDTINSSNIPRREKSAIRKWYEDVSGSDDGFRSPVARGIARAASSRSGGTSRGTAIVNTARSVGESGVVAGTLAYLHTELKNGLDVAGVPVDGALGGVAHIAQVLFPNMEVSEDVKNIANSATSIFMFRKFYSMMAERKIASGGVPGGKLNSSGKSDSMGSEDPIVECAKNL